MHAFAFGKNVLDIYWQSQTEGYFCNMGQYYLLTT